MTRIVLVVAGGAEPSLAVQSALPIHDYCVAADSGADHALAIGVVPNLVVGDLDSISSTVLDQIESGELPDVEIERHPVAKDMTDLELALRRAIETSPDRVVVVGLDGGRPDHYLANLFAVSSPDLVLPSLSGDGPEIEVLLGTTRLSVVRNQKILRGAPGELLSLLAVHGAATGISLSGVEFPLANESLESGSARGVSNVLASDSAKLTVGTGTLLVFQPDGLVS